MTSQLKNTTTRLTLTGRAIGAEYANGMVELAVSKGVARNELLERAQIGVRAGARA
jgi:hypothetical protein